MRFLSVAATLFLASASVVTAADCRAQYILDSCLKSTEPLVEDCPASDWDCLCAKYQTVLTCYNNCPDHEGRFGAQSQVTANCNAAKSYGTSTSAASKPTEASATTNGKGRGTGSGGSGGDEEEEEGTATESGEAETSTGAASGPLVVEAGGLFAAVLVGLGAWL